MIAFTGASCNYQNPDQYVVYDTLAVHTNSQIVRPSQPTMKFSGQLPCADCAGIYTELTLIPDSMTYRMKETYLNTGQGDQTFFSTGTYAINRGTTQDTGATVYQLNPGDQENGRAYKNINDSAIQALDRNLDEINSSLNYFLVKVDSI